MFGASATASRLSTKAGNLSCPGAVVDLIEDNAFCTSLDDSSEKQKLLSLLQPGGTISCVFSGVCTTDAKCWLRVFPVVSERGHLSLKT